MKFGVREIANVVFKAQSKVKIGSTTFEKGQPVIYIDTAKASTLEGAATTVYATGGRGNTRLIAWEGEKTLTFTVEDALLSPIGFAILSGAGLIKDMSEDAPEVHVHTTAYAMVDDAVIDMTNGLNPGEKVCKTAPIFVLVAEADGSITGERIKVKVNEDATGLIPAEGATFGDMVGKSVLVDFYVAKSQAIVSELQIDAENFAGYYYVEADTLFRRQADGVDLPANITLPNVKIQSNFTFAMASTGDPSTFTFTMDAMPGYTYFNPEKKVLCVIQVIEDVVKGEKGSGSVMLHNDAEKFDILDDGMDEAVEVEG